MVKRAKRSPVKVSSNIKLRKSTRKAKAVKPRKSRAKYSTRFSNAIKRIRSALAILKRKKIISKGTEVKKALPTAAMRRLVKKHEKVVKGQETTYKLPADMPKKVLDDLKALGYKVSGRGESKRLIVPTTQYVRNRPGSVARGTEPTVTVYQRPTRSRKGYKVERTELNAATIEDQVERAFKTLREGDLMGFEIGTETGRGGRSINMYASPRAMIEDLMKYQERGFKYSHLAVIRISQAKISDYAKDASRRARERVIGSPQYKERKNRMARERRAKKTGKRVSRGH